MGIGLDVISEIKANTNDKLTRQREGFRQFFTEKELEEIQESTKRDLAMKKENMKLWQKGRMAFSRTIFSCSLPMDIAILEGLAPIEYLEKFGKVAPRRERIYKQMWEHRKARKKIAPSDGSYKMVDDDLWLTVSEMWHHHITKEQYSRMKDTLDLGNGFAFRQSQFITFLGFTERFMVSDTLAQTTYKYAKDSLKTNEMEMVDFDSPAKFRQFNINEQLLTLFRFIADSNKRIHKPIN